MSGLSEISAKRCQMARDKWYQATYNQMFQAAQATESWWILDVVETYYSQIFEHASSTVAFMLSSPMLHLNGDVHSLRFMDTSEFITVSHRDGKVFFSSQAGTLSKPLFELVTRPATNIQVEILDETDFFQITQDAISRWFLMRGQTYCSELLFGIFAVVDLLQDFDYFLVELPKEEDLGGEILTIRLVSEGDWMDLVFHLEALRKSHETFCTLVNRPLLCEPDVAQSAANEE